MPVITTDREGNAPLLSVVVPHGGDAPIHYLLKSLNGQTLDPNLYEIIVAHTPENTIALEASLPQNSASLHLVRVDLPTSFRGHSAAILRNRAVAASAGDRLVFIDADTVLDEQALERHLRWHMLDSEVIVCGAWRDLPSEHHARLLTDPHLSSLEGLMESDYRAKHDGLDTERSLGRILQR